MIQCLNPKRLLRHIPVEDVQEVVFQPVMVLDAEIRVLGIVIRKVPIVAVGKNFASD